MAANRGLTHIVGGASYLIHPQTLATVAETVPPLDIRPVVLINEKLQANTVPDVTKQIERFGQIDDVYSGEFGSTLVLQADPTDALTNLMTQLNSSGLFSSVYRADHKLSTSVLPSGPYFLRGQAIHQAWRLYPDELDSFIFSVIPTDVQAPAEYTVLDSLSDDGIWKNIAVPSRLYATPSVEKPLAGARMGVKDIFQLQGVKSTMGSRSYTELYGPDQESADFVKKIVELGAVIVGKTKMASFASSEEPTDQYIDFHCPINPRGDSYQSPSGSSSGAAASLAGYPWLDYSVAGDSAGSIRAPATCNGLFSLRPSFNTTSMKGIAVNSLAFDVVGFFSRDLGDLHHIASHTFDLSDKSTKFPTRILYPLDFFPHSNQKHQAMVEDFISVLEKFLGTKRTEFRIADRWEKCPPNEAEGKPLKEYLAKSAFWSMCHDYYHGFAQFRKDYRERFGKEAYEGEIVHFRWEVGKSVSVEDHKAQVEELKVFRKWFDENVMRTDPESLSDAIMIMPYGSANPKYRDQPNESPSTSASIGEKFISPILHMPQLVLPFGQMPYQSRISGRLEHRPIASTLVGAKGSDLMLIKLAKAAFESAFWRTSIATGRYMYPLADNLRNVADRTESQQSASFSMIQDSMRSML